MNNKINSQYGRGIVLAVSVLLLSSCATTATNENVVNPRMANQYTDDVFEVSALAERAYKESRWTDAARHYQQLTEQIPGDAYIWFRLANTYTQKGDFNQAIHAYEMSIERDSLQPKPWFNLSTTYLLNAKAALLQSWENLRAQDPARALIMKRIEAIDMLMNQELGEIKVNRG
jgi:tetratricopeptide (TPR) repeat protein